jgi:hypothetical protein
MHAQLVIGGMAYGMFRRYLCPEALQLKKGSCRR